MLATLSYPKTHVISPKGNLNAANALEFAQDLTTALQHSETKALVVSLEQVESLDSAGLMALVSALKLAQSLGISMSLCSVSPTIQIVFELTQLDQVFEISKF
jgi:anti-anti-sigma factor